MDRMKSLLVLVFAGFILGYLGSYLTGYTAAFVMPESFAHYMWVWDVFVIQFLGFGVLALLLSFIALKVTRAKLLFAVSVIFVAAQLYLLYPVGFNFYFPHLAVMILCLSIGAVCAKKYA